MKKSIYQIINLKNKNCKNSKNNSKLNTNNAKPAYKQLKTTKIDVLVSQIYSFPPEVFPEYVYVQNKSYFINLSKYLAKKINSQIAHFRSLNRCTIIEFVAKDCAKQIITNDKVDIVKYINNQYGFSSFYKKEVTLLPCLIVSELFNVLVNINNSLKIIADDVKVGSYIKRYSKRANYTDAVIYGIFKYNVNSLKFAQISACNIKKCVFNLIGKLNRYYAKLTVIANYIKYLDKRFLQYTK